MIKFSVSSHCRGLHYLNSRNIQGRTSKATVFSQTPDFTVPVPRSVLATQSLNNRNSNSRVLVFRVILENHFTIRLAPAIQRSWIHTSSLGVVDATIVSLFFISRASHTRNDCARKSRRSRYCDHTIQPDSWRACNLECPMRNLTCD